MVVNLITLEHPYSVAAKPKQIITPPSPCLIDWCEAQTFVSKTWTRNINAIVKSFSTLLFTLWCTRAIQKIQYEILLKLHFVHFLSFMDGLPVHKEARRTTVQRWFIRSELAFRGLFKCRLMWERAGLSVLGGRGGDTRHKWIKGYNSLTSFKTNGNLAWPKRQGQNVILYENEEMKKVNNNAEPAVSLFLYICTCVETIRWPLNIWLNREKPNCFPKWSAGTCTTL